MRKAKTHQAEHRPGRIERSIRVDEEIYRRFTQLAKRRGVSVNYLLETAIQNTLAEESAERTERAYLPEINRVLQERHQRMESSLRSMIARVALEVLRSQYVWLNFVTEAGVSHGKVETWREQGWHYAVKEFKRQPRVDQVDD